MAIDLGGLTYALAEPLRLTSDHDGLRIFNGTLIPHASFVPWESEGSVSGTTVNKSALGDDFTADLEGTTISGSGIPEGTTVVDVVSNSQLIISQSATTSTIALKFGTPLISIGGAADNILVDAVALECGTPGEGELYDQIAQGILSLGGNCRFTRVWVRHFSDYGIRIFSGGGQMISHCRLHQWDTDDPPAQGRNSQAARTARAIWVAASANDSKIIATVAFYCQYPAQNEANAQFIGCHFFNGAIEVYRHLVGNVSGTTITVTSGNAWEGLIGAYIVGTGIPAGTTITNVVDDTLTISASATTGTAVALTSFSTDTSLAVNNQQVNINLTIDSANALISGCYIDRGVIRMATYHHVITGCKFTRSDTSTANNCYVELVPAIADDTLYGLNVTGNLLIGRASCFRRLVNDAQVTNSSPWVTSIGSEYRDTYVGAYVFGPGIPSGTTVASVNADNLLTLSQNATSTHATATLTFIRPDDQSIPDNEFWRMTLSGSASVTSAANTEIHTNTYQRSGNVAPFVPATRGTARYVVNPTSSYSTTVTGTTSNLSKLVTGVSPPANAGFVGATVSGTNIPAATTIVGIASGGTQLILSAAATGSASVTLTVDGLANAWQSSAGTYRTRIIDITKYLPFGDPGVWHYGVQKSSNWQVTMQISSTVSADPILTDEVANTRFRLRCAGQPSVIAHIQWDYASDLQL